MKKSVSLVKVLFVMLLIAVAVVIAMVVMDNKEENTNVQNQINDVSNNINNVVNNVVNEVNEVTNEIANTTVENTQNNSSTNVVSKKAYPGGFAGAGMHEVWLYSNGEVHVIVYDGSGKEETNIISNTLVAKNATDIQENEQGGVDISGDNAERLTEDYTWIKVMK